MNVTAAQSGGGAELATGRWVRGDRASGQQGNNENVDDIDTIALLIRSVHDMIKNYGRGAPEGEHPTQEPE